METKNYTIENVQYTVNRVFGSVRLEDIISRAVSNQIRKESTAKSFTTDTKYDMIKQE